MGCICRSEGADLGTVVIQLFTPVRAGSKLVVRTTYTGSLTAGLARTAAFNYTNPVTGNIQSQVLLKHNEKLVDADVADMSSYCRLLYTGCYLST